MSVQSPIEKRIWALYVDPSFMQDRFNYAARRVGLEDAADIIQDAWIGAAKAAGTFIPGSNMKAWLNRIVVNRTINYQRTYGRRAEIPFIPDYESPSRIDDCISPEDIAIQNETKQRMTEHINEWLGVLPNSYQEPIRLFFLHEMSQSEVGEQLGITQEAVKMRVFKGMKLLRERATAYEI